MTPMPDCFLQLLAAWNATDRARIRACLEAALTEDFVFVDPTVETRGIAAFEAYVCEFRRRYHGAVVRVPEAIDLAFDRQRGCTVARYRWEVMRDAAVISRGFDVAEMTDDGRIRHVAGFFGPPRRDLDDDSP